MTEHDALQTVFQLTGFQRDLLWVIAGSQRPSGQDIKQEMESEFREVGHGRLYPNLDTLVDRGLVEKGQLDRRTNYYEITETGLDALEARRQWEEQYLPFS